MCGGGSDALLPLLALLHWYVLARTTAELPLVSVQPCRWRLQDPLSPYARQSPACKASRLGACARQHIDC